MLSRLLANNDILGGTLNIVVSSVYSIKARIFAAETGSLVTALGDDSEDEREDEREVDLERGSAFIVVVALANSGCSFRSCLMFSGLKLSSYFLFTPFGVGGCGLAVSRCEFLHLSPNLQPLEDL